MRFEDFPFIEDLTNGLICCCVVKEVVDLPGEAHVTKLTGALGIVRAQRSS